MLHLASMWMEILNSTCDELTISNLSLFWNPGDEEAMPVCTHPNACPTDPCRKERRAWPPFKPPEVGGQGEDGEEKTEDHDDDEEMEGR